MGLQHDTLSDICGLATRQVEELYPNLQLMFIPHSGGQFHEVVETREYNITGHPAEKIAQSILDKNVNRELSSFLGMAIGHKAKWFGLASRESLLALININMDEFETAKDAKRGIYHLAWHAIDLYEIRQKPEYAARFRSGPMVPKRSPMNMARLNLEADIFSAVMAALMGEENAIETLAKRRAIDSISPVYTRRAEDYPFVIALETAKYAYGELKALNVPRQKYMHYARQIALQVSQTFDETNIKQWWGFSEPAQDMAWRNFTPGLVLGCAVYTSDDPFVRANAHLVSDVAQILPLEGAALGKTYNPFAGHEQNQMLHREFIERAFQEAITRGIAEESGQALLAAANEQNENLAEGRILGWCANALQAAARAFENALSSGISPAQAAALEFESNKGDASWDSLKKLGDNVVDQKRKGLGVTLSSIAEMAATQPELAVVTSAVQTTLSDPAYAPKIAPVLGHDFAAKPAGPAGPSGPAPASPSFKAAPAAPQAMPVIPSGPSLGGAPSAVFAAQRRAMMEKLRAEQNAPDTSSGE